GVERCSRRIYDHEPAGSLGTQVIQLKDPKAAYSLATLLRDGALRSGPPGDFVASGPSGIVFAQVNYLVRIRAEGAPDVVRPVAASVSNRIGRHEVAPPLIGRFPTAGEDSASLRYFVSRQSFDRYTASGALAGIEFPGEVEIGQAAYRVGEQRGILSIVGFPTSQLAEQFYNDLFASVAWTPKKQGLYFKRAGPLVGVLDGAFDAA